VTIGNRAMIDAYRGGCPGNGKPFRDGANMAKIHWTPKKAETEPDRASESDLRHGHVKQDGESPRYGSPAGTLPDAQGQWDTHLRRAALMASVWAGFLTGAIVSGAASLYFGVWVLLPPFLIMLALAVSGGADGTHSTECSPSSTIAHLLVEGHEGTGLRESRAGTMSAPATSGALQTTNRGGVRKWC
jgi:hypothetical protein